MDIKYVSADYSVSGQIDERDLPALVAAGFTTLISNRPDIEISADQHALIIQEQAQHLGLQFIHNPIAGNGMTMENITRQADALAASKGPVFAYCRSGTRSTVCWAFAMAGNIPVDTIVSAANAAGYALEGMRPQLEAMAAHKS